MLQLHLCPKTKLKVMDVAVSFLSTTSRPALGTEDSFPGG